MEKFPDNTHHNYGGGHLATQRPTHALPLLIDWQPAFVLNYGIESLHVASGWFRDCAPAYGTEGGWPCSRWLIETVFPLQPCFVDGIVVPCPADLATYSSLDAQGAYVANGLELLPQAQSSAGAHSTSVGIARASGLRPKASKTKTMRCDGCTTCLLWNQSDGSQSYRAITTRVSAMERLQQCGFGNLLNLVPTLVAVRSPGTGEITHYCGCGVGTWMCGTEQ